MMRLLHGVAGALLLVAIAFGAAPGPADEVDEAARLWRQGEVGTAEQRVDALLKKRPKDARVRFLKGLILAETKRADDAAAVFTALIEDYPELPEPYNNLAVLHAAAGRYDRAREALEAAVRARPDFATAHENLGDIYVRMAIRSYDLAAKLDAKNETASQKLRLADQLLTTRTSQPATAKPVAR